MKTIIYYFTGTGNSHAAAKSICTQLGDCELVSIASLAGTSGGIQPGNDRLVRGSVRDNCAGTCPDPDR